MQAKSWHQNFPLKLKPLVNQRYNVSPVSFAELERKRFLSDIKVLDASLEVYLFLRRVRSSMRISFCAMRLKEGFTWRVIRSIFKKQEKTLAVLVSTAEKNNRRSCNYGFERPDKQPVLPTNVLEL
jgi:hypothetical protein